MTRIAHPHMKASFGGLGYTRGLGGEWPGAGTDLDKAYVPDPSKPDEWILICGNHSSAGRTCKLMPGREVDQVVNLGANNKWWSMRYDAEGHQVHTTGNGTIRVIYKPAVSKSKLPDYGDAERKIQTMIDRINSCEIDRNTPVPSAWKFPVVPSDASDAEKAAYDSYSLALNRELPDARADASVFCSAGGGSGGSATGQGGGDPNATTDPAQGYGGGSYVVPAPAPGSDPYGNTAYEQTADNWQGGGTVVSNPFGPPPAPVVSVDRGMSRGAKIGAGGLVLAGALVFVGLMRKKRSGSASIRSFR